MLYVTLFIL